MPDRLARLGLYVIPDAVIGRGTLVEQTTAALAGGAGAIQLRGKHLTTRALLEVGTAMRDLCRRHDALFIVNDRVDVALALEADGAHLGEDDLPLAVARRLLGPAAIIGASYATPELARAAEADGADYLGIGPVYATGSKADAGEAIGVAGLRAIVQATRLPVVGIGGIGLDNVTEVMAAGAVGVAVISAVVAAEDITAAAAALRVRVEG